MQNNHRYFIAWPDTSAPTIEIPSPKWTDNLAPEVRYPLAVLAEAVKSIQAAGLHFYLTRDPDRLPAYGPHVVAVLLQEERCKVPRYARHVRAVIRNLQTIPFTGFRLHAHMGRLEAVETFEYIRDWAIHLRSQLRMHGFAADGVAQVSDRPHLFTIPLGYHSQKELPIVPMRERTLDSFFSGDVRAHYQRDDYRYWTSSSKVEARRQLWNAIERLSTSDPRNEWKILRNETSGDPTGADAAAYGGYSERMQQSRICLAPRGSVAETFRFFEGLRAGCLVMTNRLPDLPFLTGAPFVLVDHWRDLPKLLRKYARDLPALEEYSRASRQWWAERCSEPIIGKQVASFLNTTCAH